jgi:hypothetical protein
LATPRDRSCQPIATTLRNQATSRRQHRWIEPGPVATTWARTRGRPSSVSRPQPALAEAAQHRASQHDQIQAQHAAAPPWPSSRPTELLHRAQYPSHQSERTRTKSPSRSNTLLRNACPPHRITPHHHGGETAALVACRATRAAGTSSSAGTSAGEFACKVPAPPRCPVLSAVSSSHTSGPRTSPTTRRSGRIRNA